jgi:hypothetical protein
MDTARITLVLCLLLVASTARAVTEQELLGQASGLASAYDSLDTRVDACPDGACQDAASIVADLATLTSVLAEIHAARATLGACGCQQLDAAISALDDLDRDLHVIVDNWEPIG